MFLNAAVHTTTGTTEVERNSINSSSPTGNIFDAIRTHNVDNCRPMSSSTWWLFGVAVASLIASKKFLYIQPG